MAKYRSQQQKLGFGLPRRVWLLMLSVVLASFVGVILAQNIYNRGLEPVNNNQQTQIFTVKQGSTVKQIASNLQDDKLIRSAWAMELYVHSKELSEKLQAGTYALSPSQGTRSIVRTITRGYVATRLVTILPGQRIDQVRASLINDGFSPNDVDAALVPDQYSDLPALAIKPANINSLEGLLWPDSFQKDPTTSPSVIIRESLVEMGQQLTPDIQASFARQGLTTYQGVTLASILIQEVNKPTDQAQAAQVFLKRLKSDMVLGSDVTARYGAIKAGRAPSLSYDSPYNTLLNKGLPPSPISTINSTSLAAAANPAATDWLYFVAGDDGTTYFSKTYQEHQALTDRYCHKLCGR